MTISKTTHQLHSDIKKYQKQIKTLEAVLEKANHQNEIKSQYLGHLAHELRTPLNAIIGFSQMLTRHTVLTDEQKEYLNLVLLSGESMLSLIEDILQMTQIEAGEVKLNPMEFDFYELINEIESIYQAAASEKGVGFKVIFSRGTPRFIRADRTKIQQILNNLLSNALKFTGKGSITIEIYPGQIEGKEDHNLITISVHDTGAGIKAEELEYLFKPYKQTTSGLDSKKGTGLGLAITKEFVRLMDGQIAVESEWQKGTTFTVQISVEVASKRSLHNVTAPQVTGIVGNGYDYRILVVDDHEEQRSFLKKMLSKVGFDVDVATNGEDAIHKWQSWQPQLILMDMRMANMDGYTATRKIRDLEAGSHVKIFALTASAFEAENGVDFLTSCDDFLQKPLSLGDLFHKIQSHLDVKFTYGDTIHETQEAHAVYPSNLDIEMLEQDLQQRLQAAASSYSLERLQSVVAEFPQQADRLASFILDKSVEFDFNAIIGLFATSTE